MQTTKKNEILKLQLELFFREPKDFCAHAKKHGALHLLRRDLNQSLCDAAGSSAPLTASLVNWAKVRFSLWPATIIMFIGIDLLGAHLLGKPAASSGKRIAAYVGKYFQMTHKSDVDHLVKYRNALLHNFGDQANSHRPPARLPRFYIDPLFNELVDELPTNKGERNYRIGFQALLENFDRSVKAYRNDIIRNPDLAKKFGLVYLDFGEVSFDWAISAET